MSSTGALNLEARGEGSEKKMLQSAASLPESDWDFFEHSASVVDPRLISSPPNSLAIKVTPLPNATKPLTLMETNMNETPDFTPQKCEQERKTEPIEGGILAKLVTDNTIGPTKVLPSRGRGRPRKWALADPIPAASDSNNIPAPARRKRTCTTDREKGGSNDWGNSAAKAKRSRAPKNQPNTARLAKGIYDDKDERDYEEAIKDRGVRLWESFPVERNECIDHWAELLGIPMRTLRITPDKECLTFPFDMQELEEVEVTERVRAFIFFGPDSLHRKPPEGDKSSFAIPFLSQQSVGYGHALDSCASLSLVNIVLNCPTILKGSPISMKLLRKTLVDDKKVKTTQQAWRVFDQSVIGEQVHEVHNRIASADGGQDTEKTGYNPQDYKEKIRYSQRKSDALSQDTPADRNANERFHFTALMQVNGFVWELDSMETEPIKIAKRDRRVDWKDEVRLYVQDLTQDLSSYEKNYVCKLIPIIAVE
ncbi:hypothetical protein BGX28_009645 [Mortierella sp. GBA30]|nr:hypothetical protein BGX28_009645 [Mortierella sp. GBA30]